MDKSRLVFVIPGYGCRLDEVLQTYLEVVVGAIADECPDVVITSGGQTAHRTAPGCSEAQLMVEQIRGAVDAEQREAIAWLLDEQARTTLENIRHARRIIDDQLGTVDHVVIFCDRTRAPKIAMMARHLMRGYCWELRPCELKRSALHALVQGTVALAYDAVALRWPRFERAGLRIKDLWIHIS